MAEDTRPARTVAGSRLPTAASGSRENNDASKLAAHLEQSGAGHTCEFCQRIEAQLVPAPRIADVDQAPDPVATTRSRRSFGRGAVVISALLVAVVIAIVVVILTRPSHHGSPAVTASRGAQSTASAGGGGARQDSVELHAAATWAAVQLPHAAQILADHDTQVALAAAGFTAVETVPSAAAAPASAATDPTPPSFEYVISTSTLRAQADSDPALANALNSALPVADFGSGAQQIVVGQASSDPAAVVAKRRSTDVQIRRSAETELIANPAIRAVGTALAALQSGQLDLRAATVLAFLANSSHVDLINVTVDPPEQAAGLPIRSIDVISDSQSAMQTILSTLPLAYQPASITPLSNGADRVVWPISAEPPLGLNS
jgi:hypothetical protein